MSDQTWYEIKEFTDWWTYYFEVSSELSEIERI
jgi:hypothetical protein